MFEHITVDVARVIARIPERDQVQYGRTMTTGSGPHVRLAVGLLDAWDRRAAAPAGKGRGRTHAELVAHGRFLGMCDAAYLVGYGSSPLAVQQDVRTASTIVPYVINAPMSQTGNGVLWADRANYLAGLLAHRLAQH